MDGTFSALQRRFLAESARSLDEMEKALVVLRARPTAHEQLHPVRRGAHTMTRGAAALGLESLAAFAHVVEEVAERLQQGRSPVSGVTAELLQRAAMALGQMVSAAVEGHEELLPAHRTLLEELRNAATPSGSPPDRPAR